MHALRRGLLGRRKGSLILEGNWLAMACTASSCCAIDAPRLAAREVHSTGPFVLHEYIISEWKILGMKEINVDF